MCVLDQRRYYLLEGYLAPDTYRYLTSATEEDLIRKQLDQFSKILSMKKEGRRVDVSGTCGRIRDVCR